MTTKIYSIPAHDGKGELPIQLKYVIAKRFWGHDGTLSGDGVYLQKRDEHYLRGIIDASSNPDVVKGAETLIELMDESDNLDGVMIYLE